MMTHTNPTSQAPALSALRDSLILGKVVAVLRGDFRGKWAQLADALIAGGIPAIEVTLTSQDALQGISALRDHCGDRALIGAGTALTPEHVDQAVDAGARYVVAPNVNEQVIAHCAVRGALSIPGAYTPTEIELAWRLGAGIVKVFPSMPIGPDYIRNIRGPLPDIPIICTGGITVENAAAFLKAGANAIGLTSALVNDKALDFDRVRERASALMHSVRGN